MRDLSIMREFSKLFNLKIGKFLSNLQLVDPGAMKVHTQIS